MLRCRLMPDAALSLRAHEQFHEIQQFTNLFNDVTPTVTQYWTGPVEVPNYTLAESQAAGCAMMSR